MEVSLQNEGTGILLTNENLQSYPQYSAWSFFLGKPVRVCESAAVDVNPFDFNSVRDRTGVVKGVLVSSSPGGQIADLAVEFPFLIRGGHTCQGLCLPHRGLWFGIERVVVNETT